MFFWLIATVLLFAAIGSVAWPILSRAGAKAVPAFEHDRELYRARIGEITADEKLGRINAEEAEAAKAEEGRKLLAASNAQGSAPAPLSSGIVRSLLVATIVLVPAFTVLFYLAWGQPSMPDMAIASRTDREPEGQSIEQLVSQAEAQLAKNPGDVRGWTVLAPIYRGIGRFEDSVNAWRNAVRLEPQNLDYKSELAEAMIVAGQGFVSEEARTIFSEILAARPGDPKSRFYLAIALGQQGDLVAAEDAWRALIADAPADAPWLFAASAQLNSVLEKAGKPAEETASAGPGPSQEDVAAASEMSAEDRQAMIEGMVAGLAEKLKANPADKDGWLRLIRAYGVMGDDEKALEAIATARGANGTDGGFIAELAGIENSIRQKAGSTQ
ncbi:MAG TPA: c-type cytochrome biogenesis protein CcmI [Rhizobiaceae bacterium]|nr:c-type cytochrome biogenesis protein CcmI [Rhizobiaceae bacterium]